ncbi:Sarcolemmal membrane-associated protein [Strongyloides ratti]|uniref:Sarcolemmal membrane-associated protein n=1 Tax=Strongyloides ratti TaxID=34506 RepID=A0A090LKX9_STRRB|nr:Sarcolemmal membrane-associated protein [Strongyloides ratti]CEF70370.1 Sarcolemmal membrane-associated protein [Strongyloides ratti]
MVISMDVMNEEAKNLKKYKGQRFAVFIPSADSHTFERRKVFVPDSESKPITIGRSVGKSRPSNDNAVFDCKVLSRHHAIMWWEEGTFYIKDTKSSNGTYVNNERLSKTAEESAPKALYSGDIIQLGVEIIDSSNKISSGCIIAILQFINGNDEDIASVRPFVQKPIKPPKTDVGDGSQASSSNLPNITETELFQLQQYIKEATYREKLLNQKIQTLQEAVVSAAEAAETTWNAAINEESMLEYIILLEHQLAIYSKSITLEQAKDDLKRFLESKTIVDKNYRETFKALKNKENAAVERAVEAETKIISLKKDLEFLKKNLEESEERNRLTEITCKDLKIRLKANDDRCKELEEKIKDINLQFESRDVPITDYVMQDSCNMDLPRNKVPENNECFKRMGVDNVSPADTDPITISTETKENVNSLLFPMNQHIMESKVLSTAYTQTSFDEPVLDTVPVETISNPPTSRSSDCFDAEINTSFSIEENILKKTTDGFSQVSESDFDTFERVYSNFNSFNNDIDILFIVIFPFAAFILTLYANVIMRRSYILYPYII